MKKAIVIVAVCALASWSQTASAKTMYAGVKGGLNIASLTGDDADGLDSHNGFIGGAFYGVDFTEDFGARIEGLYVMGGAEGPYETLDGDTHDAIIKLDYLQFPILFVANIPANEKVGFSLFAGPTFGFNMIAEAEIPDHGETEDFSSIVNSFEFGATIGGGVEYALSSMSIFAEGRYSMGATNVIDADPSDVKNRGIGIMGGVKIPLGSK